MNHRIFLPLLFAWTLQAQQIVIPFIECTERVNNQGVSILTTASSAGTSTISLSQPVPFGTRVVLNPGGATQERFFILRYETTSPPFIATIKESVGFNFPTTLAFNHSAGELVSFEVSGATGYFGYFNPNTIPVEKVAGSFANFLSPGDPNRGQPSLFVPGVFRNVLALPFPPNRDIVWFMGDSSIAVGRDTPELNCARIKPEVRAQSITLGLNSTTPGVRIGTVSGGAPGSYAATIANVFMVHPTSNSTLSIGDIQFSNLRVENGTVFADVTTTALALQRRAYFVLRVTDAAGQHGFSTGGIEVVSTCPITVSPTFLSTAFINTPYNVTFNAPGATQFAVEGELPSGMGLSEAGQLSGAPTQTGTFSFSLRTARIDGCFQRTPLTLEVQGQLCSANVTGFTQVTLGGFRQNLVTRRWQQTVTIRNTSQSSIFGPLSLVTDNLSANAALVSASGATSCAAPLGVAYQSSALGPSNQLAPGATVSLNLEFTNNTPGAPITYTPRVIAGGAIR